MLKKIKMVRSAEKKAIIITTKFVNKVMKDYESEKMLHSATQIPFHS